MGFLSRLTGYLQGVFKHLNPAPPIGGLEISDSALRYVLFENNVPQVAALRLPPGILENGRVKDRANFVAALKNVRGQIPVPSKKRVHVIVSFPPALVYAQAFSLPLVSETNLEEAARLNLQMISPTDPKNTYSDWQRIEAPNESENIELLGALIENKAADELIAALREAGFLAVAAEFPALSLARLAEELGAGFDPRTPAIIVNLSSDGIDYAIVRGGNLYFNYFVSWRTIVGSERALAADVFKNSVVRNLQQVMTFYAGRWGGPVKNVTLVSQGLEEEIKGVILKNFPDTQVSPLALGRSVQIPLAYFVALGAALRGRISRGADTIISLLSVGTEDEYRQNQVRLFVALWRNIVFSALGFLVALFLITEFFVVRIDRRVAAELTQGTAQPEVAEVAKLEEEARSFNRAVAFVGTAKNAEVALAPIVRDLQALAAKGRVSLDRVAISSIASPILIVGRANSEEEAIGFRKLLEDDPQIEKADLPLSLIVKAERGVTFSITATLAR